MRRGEFQIIDRFFTHDAFGEWRSQGVGDDCAIIDMPGNRIAVTTDMMAVGTHFLPGARPEDIGYKALAVNLSDLAAAGASPRAFFLSIGLPERDDEWLAGFSRGLMALAESSGCALLGGDTTRTAEVGGTHAPVTISITAMGSLPEGKGTHARGREARRRHLGLGHGGRRICGAQAPLGPLAADARCGRGAFPQNGSPDAEEHARLGAS